MPPSKTCDYAGYAPPPHYAKLYANLRRSAQYTVLFLSRYADSRYSQLYIEPLPNSSRDMARCKGGAQCNSFWPTPPDKEVVLATVTQNRRSALYFAAEALCADKEFMLAVVAQDGTALSFASALCQRIQYKEVVLLDQCDIHRVACPSVINSASDTMLGVDLCRLLFHMIAAPAHMIMYEYCGFVPRCFWLYPES
eukprot:SAG25_NODE_1433_length_3034_cov_2.112095_8_plen_196_part_01